MLENYAYGGKFISFWLINYPWIGFWYWQK